MTRQSTPLVIGRLVLATTLTLAASTLAAAQSASAQSLSARIDAALADKGVASNKMSVVVARLSTNPGTAPEILYQRNGKTPLMPASNMKVLTSSAALAGLGRDFKFRTTLVLRDAGAGLYDVVLIGDGDPTLGDPEFSQQNAANPTWLLDKWAAELAGRGIKQVRHVIVDDSVFDEDFLHDGWPSNQTDRDYVAQVGGANWAFNCIRVFVNQANGYRLLPSTKYVAVANSVKTGDKSAIGLGRKPGTNQLVLSGTRRGSGGEIPLNVTIHDPGGYTATLLAEALARQGITSTGVTGKNRQMRQQFQKAPSAFTVIGIHETPISAVLPRVNKDSANLYAEAIGKRLGHQMAGGQPGSWANAHTAVAAYLQSVGVDPSQFTLDDGCGLSRGNRISAELLVRVLAADFAGANRDVFLSSLAVGGQDGTLERRFTGDLAGRVYGKTGYINSVSSLSGVLQAKNGHWYAFAVIFNELKGSVGSAKQAQDRVVAAIDTVAR
jgi:D-alanyl-D-alanine carboxypeptidase/D-alanyl-D-alanine-endopeptidase (penicillin-binding protein 4)